MASMMALWSRGRASPRHVHFEDFASPCEPKVGVSYVGNCIVLVVLGICGVMSSTIVRAGRRELVCLLW